MAEYKGIDISSNNGTLDWSKIKAAGMSFAVIRSSYGRYKVDTQFAANVKGATAQGIPYGVYHYSYALNASAAREEAALVLNTIKDCKLAFPIWFDMEDADGYKVKNGLVINKANITAICKAFVEAIRAAGYSVGIYASKSWLESYIDTTQLGDCAYWLAQWNTKPTWSGSFSLWQYSDSGKISGCNGSFDLDICYTNPAAKTVTAMQQDAACAAGVIRYVGAKTILYKDAQLETEMEALLRGVQVKYYGNHCYVDGEKYAYVSAPCGSGYVKAADLRLNAQ